MRDKHKFVDADIALVVSFRGTLAALEVFDQEEAARTAALSLTRLAKVWLKKRHRQAAQLALWRDWFSASDKRAYADDEYDRSCSCLLYKGFKRVIEEGCKQTLTESHAMKLYNAYNDEADRLAFDLSENHEEDHHQNEHVHTLLMNWAAIRLQRRFRSTRGDPLAPGVTSSQTKNVFLPITFWNDGRFEDGDLLHLAKVRGEGRGIQGFCMYTVEGFYCGPTLLTLLKCRTLKVLFLLPLTITLPCSPFPRSMTPNEAKRIRHKLSQRS